MTHNDTTIKALTPSVINTICQRGKTTVWSSGRDAEGMKYRLVDSGSSHWQYFSSSDRLWQFAACNKNSVTVSFWQPDDDLRILPDYGNGTGAYAFHSRWHFIVAAVKKKKKKLHSNLSPFQFTSVPVPLHFKSDKHRVFLPSITSQFNYAWLYHRRIN